jgi:hypothetical protein
MIFASRSAKASSSLWFSSKFAICLLFAMKNKSAAVVITILVAATSKFEVARFFADAN